MPPRKRKLDVVEEKEDSVEAENGVRGKRRAAVAARAKVVVTRHDEVDSEEEELDEVSEEDEDDNDEDFEEEGNEDEDDEAGEPKEDKDEAEEDEDNEEDDEDDEDVDADAIKVECVEAVLDEPTKDVPGYVLKSKEDDKKQKLQMWFSEEMSETVGDITEAFSNHYEGNKLPVLQVTKFDVIEERDDIYQIDVLEAKFDKAYSIRDKDEESEEDTDLAHNLYCLIRIEGTDKTWATQYFMPEEE